MAKCVIVFTVSLTALIFIAGCEREPTESQPDKRTEVTHTQVRPAKAEASKTEITKIEVSQIASTEAEPVKSETVKTGSPKAKTAKPERIKVEASKDKQRQSKPSKAAAFHNKCADILSRFVDDKGMVNYKMLKRQRLQLKSLLREFANLDPNEYNSWSKEDKIALRLNAYNIQMLKIITSNYPIKTTRWQRFITLHEPLDSIRHIKGIWSDYKFLVMDEEFTLIEVENRFFRKEFGEPRVFFAISRASYSSPPLRNEAYYGNKLYKQLDDQVKRFLSNPLAFKIERKKKEVYLSAILQPSWYGRHFIGKYGTDKKFKEQKPATRAVLNFLTNYLSERDVSFLQLENYSVKYITYNWKLNDNPKKQ